jgi:hypothetical protein
MAGYLAIGSLGLLYPLYQLMMTQPYLVLGVGLLDNVIVQHLFVPYLS